MLLQVVCQNLHDLILFSLQPYKNLPLIDLFPSQAYIFAAAEISLEVVSTFCNIMKHNQRTIFLVKSPNLQIVLVKDDKIALPLVLEKTGVYFFDHYVGYVKSWILFLSWDIWRLP